ncbi:flavodoxin-dependent (E)-4-hydroxy-3-methylbut-2-enyl-diphosphate synthase [Thiohalorhabdus methylotrophus]|uniref:4-hydroxy-3-methylbut-2-en-1-yl diphosphate synthase (flavodoxin) n=1 Tax=Thiohalorhabdus methylotrophus TaxID=3242694 RepID=A0ABV4TXJ1_9GAMM
MWGIHRRKTRQIHVGSVPIGGDAPIAVQTMTNTNTCDVEATVGQIQQVAQAGADIVRVSVPDKDAAEAFGKIRARVPDIPLVADIHFDYRIALKVADMGVDCLRINPGNIGKRDRVAAVVDAAKHNGIPIRVGVNAGSLEKHLLEKYSEPNAEAMAESALRHLEILESHDFYDTKISLKASDVFLAVEAYRKLATQVDYPFHLGITEAGSLRMGTVRSSVGLGMLLADGIGDTLRVSLAADPVEEVKVGFDILKSLHLRHRGVNIIACPSCSRQEFNVIDTVNELEARLEDVNENLNVSIIGCVVNGVGEAKEADVGVTGGGKNLVYIDGEPSYKVDNETLIDRVERSVRDYVAKQKQEADASATQESGGSAMEGSA